MVRNRAKRNIWLALAILSGVAIIDHAISLAMGEMDWWQLVSVIIIATFISCWITCRLISFIPGSKWFIGV